MFNDLSKGLAIISGLILTMILVIFGAAFFVAQEQQKYTIQAPQEPIEVKPPVVLTEQQELGESLFKTNCASCHKRYKKAVGPALYGVTERRDQEWLYKWIVNSSQLIQSGDAQAVAIYNEYNQSNMNAFPQLSNDDIDAILSWVEIPK
ncbi:cytochrome c [Nonlabens dokdonensis]|uniref:Cytochrome c n=2 Tax=Nonlabens dokdonensis TaxID=328515 RepID=A0ABX5PWG1_9FLAO|nr:cytochrome c [Nonlabens dokdonensis]PZX39231.1 cytochrome c [Nonlabens dokdonensis]